MGKHKEIFCEHLDPDDWIEPTEAEVLDMHRLAALRDAQAIEEELEEIINRVKYYGDDVRLSTIEELLAQVKKLLQLLD